MQKKKILFSLLLLMLPIAYATNVPLIVNVSTNNGSVSLFDSTGQSETYSCMAQQTIKFRGTQTYDITMNDCKPYLTNVTCSVANLECAVPEGRFTAMETKITDSYRTDLATAKNELMTNLPTVFLDRTNFTSVVDLGAKYQGCLAELGPKDNELDVLHQQNNQYAMIIAGLIILIIALFSEYEWGFFSNMLYRRRME